MRVSMAGTGYVGLVSGVCFAEFGHEVTCIDVDPRKVEMLSQGKCPIYEPGIEDLLERNIAAKRLSFSTNYESVKNADVIFLAVGTPPRANGEANLDYIKDAAATAAKNIKDGAVIVIKSTVPVGTCAEIEAIMGKTTNKKFFIVNNPEFLKEGSAIEDFMKPDRVVIGHSDEQAYQVMEELYLPLVRQGNPIYQMSNLSAEMTKYAANCFLAAKISFINEIARLCEVTGADIDEVRKGIMSDRRIGHQFLYPGLGYGGSCFPKDVDALIRTGQKLGVRLEVTEAANRINNDQRLWMIENLKKHFPGGIQGKTFAFWGVSFKPNTDDIREAPSLYMAHEIFKMGGRIRIYDPVATTNFLDYFKGHKHEIEIVPNKYACLDQTDGLFLITEWPEFRTADFIEIKSRLRSGVVFDGRNIFTPQKVAQAGLSYYAIGKKPFLA